MKLIPKDYPDSHATDAPKHDDDDGPKAPPCDVDVAGPETDGLPMGPIIPTTDRVVIA